MTESRFSVLFVCMGNICRSPTAHGVFLAKLTQSPWANGVQVDSAGTHAYHVGEPPDKRSQAHAFKRGYDLSRLRARQVSITDFEHYDLVLYMDDNNAEALRAMCPAHMQPKLKLFTSYGQRFNSPHVPDPYYGGDSGFERVLDLVEDASDGLLAAIAQQLCHKGTR